MQVIGEGRPPPADLVPDRRLDAAIAALGWQGEIASDVDLLGDRVDVAYRWNDGHEPDCFAEGAVQIVGVLVRRPTWRTGRRIAAGFSAFGPVAVLVPPDRAGAVERLDAERLGIGLLLDVDRPAVAVAPAPFTPPDWTPVQRLVQETVHAVLCAQADGSDLPPVPGDAPEGSASVGRPAAKGTVRYLG